MEIFIGSLVLYLIYILFYKSKKTLVKDNSEIPIDSNSKISVSNELKKENLVHNDLSKSYNINSTKDYYSQSNISNKNFQNKQTTKNSQQSAVWYGKNQFVQVRNYSISKGFVYVGDKLINTRNENNSYYQDYVSNDASLINPSLNIVSAESWEYGDEMGYWPNYANIPAKCRGAYLKWLSNGRIEPNTNIGYVFLFFYGLERRIFVDAIKSNVSVEERKDIVNEVLRLLEMYGGNNSFKMYARNFLAMEWLLFNRNDEKIPDYLKFNGHYHTNILRFLLAKSISKQEPLSYELALDWTITHPTLGIRLKTPARRCPNEFKELFKQRYTQKFGQGIIVKANKTPLELNYIPASFTITNVLISKEKLNLPDPIILTAPIKKIIDLVEECTKQLDSYSKYIGREGNTSNSLYAQSLLPKELLQQSTYLNKLKEKLENNEKEIIVMKLTEIYDLLQEKSPLVIDKKESENLATLIELLDFGIAPDNRYHHLKPTINGQIIIFKKGHGINFNPSQEFTMLCSILRLGAIVSQIDGEVSHQEEKLLYNLIQDNRKLTNIEKDSLNAFLQWALITPQEISGLKKKLEIASQTEKTAIGHILISIAHADGRIDLKEIKQLEKLYTLLGLDKAQVLSDLHQLSTSNEPIIIDYKDKDTSYSIPKPENKPTSSFTLNDEIIKIREAETLQIKGVLGAIFTNDEDLEENNINVIEENIETNSPLTTLDEPHQKFFNQLITKELWEKEEIQIISKELGLMPDGAMEVLNEWAFDNANAPLIEDDEKIYIDIELAKEIINEQ